MSLFKEVIDHLRGVDELADLLVMDPSAASTGGGVVVIVRDASTEKSEEVRLDIKGPQIEAIDARSHIAQVLQNVKRDTSNDEPNYAYPEGAYKVSWTIFEMVIKRDESYVGVSRWL